MKPKLLELFAGAQGAGVGFARAGFKVTAVDIEPHAKHPEIHEFITRDALKVLADTTYLKRFAVITAGPPCQFYTTLSNRARLEWPDLIGRVRVALRAWGGVYVIENVPGAARWMVDPITLHGGMFDLGVSRPRLFESNRYLTVHRGKRVANPIGVYGKLDGRRLWTRADGSEQRAASSLHQARAAMGIDWMNWADLREAIPPAYTKYLGTQLIRSL